jgi:hypothetical protein
MRRSRVIGIGLTAVVLIGVMALTGPRPETEMTGLIRRMGGACVQLEQWGLFGWVIVGQSYSVSDILDGDWHTPPSSNPPCEDVPEAAYLVRMPLEAAPDVYRLCGLADDWGCLEFTMIPLERTPAP